MATCMVDLEESDQDSVPGPEEVSPHSVLGVPADASVEDARDAAEAAVSQMSGREGSEWLLNMKLAAFAAIVTDKLGALVAWQLYQQVRPKQPTNNNLQFQRDIRGLAEPPPPPSRVPPPRPSAGAARRQPPARGLSDKAADESRSSSWEVVTDSQEGASMEVEDVFWWQVRKGPKDKRKWGWMDEQVNARLEEAWEGERNEVYAEIDGWEYLYDLVAMTQTSQSAEGTTRRIRRVICDGNDREGWALRCEVAS